jgi:hypothetical protein
MVAACEPQPINFTLRSSEKPELSFGESAAHRQGFACDEINDHLGDIRSVIADSLDVFRTEQEMRSKHDVVRIFHHKGEQIADNRVLQCVEVRIAHPNTARAFSIPLRISIERIPQKSGRQFMHRPKPDNATRYAQLRFDPYNPLGNILGEIANALEIAWNSNSRDDFAKIRRQRLPPRDRRIATVRFFWRCRPVALDCQHGAFHVSGPWCAKSC